MAPLTLTPGCRKETSRGTTEILSMGIILDTNRFPPPTHTQKKEKKIVSALGVWRYTNVSGLDSNSHILRKTRRLEWPKMSVIPGRAIAPWLRRFWLFQRVAASSRYQGLGLLSNSPLLYSTECIDCSALVPTPPLPLFQIPMFAFSHRLSTQWSCLNTKGSARTWWGCICMPQHWSQPSRAYQVHPIPCYAVSATRGWLSLWHSGGWSFQWMEP